MILGTTTFLFIGVLITSLVYTSVFYNLPNAFPQVFEVNENDYFDFDESSEDTESDSAEKSADKSGKKELDSDTKKTSKKSEKKSKSDVDEDFSPSIAYVGKYDKEDVEQYYVQKYYLNGTFISGWGERGTEDGQFLHAHNIAVDSDKNVYVTDERRSDVQKFDS
ncbi:MAG: hypothetical protein R3321_06935, partial [Nitrososphaeraceae archaeon]|nr:hypothetical protein [Nitrososphaeraceae archaeon]